MGQCGNKLDCSNTRLLHFMASNGRSVSFAYETAPGWYFLHLAAQGLWLMADLPRSPDVNLLVS